MILRKWQNTDFLSECFLCNVPSIDALSHFLYLSLLSDFVELEDSKSFNEKLTEDLTNTIKNAEVGNLNVPQFVSSPRYESFS